jgi:hypothetical protein
LCGRRPLPPARIKKPQTLRRTHGGAALAATSSPATSDSTLIISDGDEKARFLSFDPSQLLVPEGRDIGPEWGCDPHSITRAPGQLRSGFLHYGYVTGKLHDIGGDFAPLMPWLSLWSQKVPLSGRQ